jgi:hypothetical protein
MRRVFILCARSPERPLPGALPQPIVVVPCGVVAAGDVQTGVGWTRGRKGDLSMSFSCFDHLEMDSRCLERFRRLRNARPPF